jgi:hypothetical protein
MTELNAAEIETPAAPATETVETPAKAAETEAKPAEVKPAPAAKTEETPAPKGGQKPSIATGGDTEVEDKAKEAETAETKAAKIDRNELTEDLRKMIAEHYAAGDKKAEARELKRLDRIKDVKSLWGMYRELDNRLNGGGLVKVPGKDAKPEELAAYHKAMGVPEKPEDYFKDVKLDNGAVIGEADKPLVDGFAQAVHKSGATPAFVNAALNWYYGHQEQQAAAMDEADDTFRRESERALKDEFGAAFKRKTNAIASVFATAPGGTDVANEKGLYARLMGGRTADGKLIGNDPDMVRFLVGLAHEINPAATVVEDGNQSGLSIDAELGAIRKRMREDRRGYDKDVAMQNRFRELITAQQKIQARA